MSLDALLVVASRSISATASPVRILYYLARLSTLHPDPDRHTRVVQDSCILQPGESSSCNTTLIIPEPTKNNDIWPSPETNMPATTVEEWLQDKRIDEPPHRCRKIIREWATEDGAFVECRADDGAKQTHKLVAMSSLSRRACYKCGNVGHYAEVCASAERLCYNCKQPGHESNGCPLPRTTEAKQCYHCQGLGHVQADCPTLRISGAGTSGRCYNCGQPGHLARSCSSPAGTGPVPGAGRGAGVPRGGYGGGFTPRGGFTGGPRPATCYKCGGPNHFARDCQAQAMKCYACGKLGHISRDCTSPNGGPLNTAGKTCYQCGEAGHISRDCPQKATNGDVPAEAVDLGVTPAAAPVAPVA